MWKAFTIPSFILLSVALSDRAMAFQQTMTCYETGQYRCRPGEIAKPAFWPVAGRTTAIPGRTDGPDYLVYPYGVSPIEGEATDEMSERLLAEIQAGFAVWNDVECSPLEMKFLGRTPISAQESYGTSNRRDDRGTACAWDDEACLNAETSTSLGLCGPSDPPVCEHANIVVFRPFDWPVHYASSTAFAITSVNVDPDTGQIVDADVEFNLEFQPLGVDEWSTTPSQTVDIRTTAAHEAGHFLGLDHSEVQESTMYRRAAPGETNKRDLLDDDIEGLCSIYPEPTSPSNGPRASIPVDDGCCAITSRPQSKLRGALVFVILLLSVWFPRPKSSTSRH